MYQLMVSSRFRALAFLPLLAAALSLPAASASAATLPQARPVPQVETGASFDARRGLVTAAPAAASAAPLAAIDEPRAATGRPAVRIRPATRAARPRAGHGGRLPVP